MTSKARVYLLSSDEPNGPSVLYEPNSHGEAGIYLGVGHDRTPPMTVEQAREVSFWLEQAALLVEDGQRRAR